MDTTRLATIYSGKSGVSSKLTRARNAVLGTYAHCSNVAILLDDKPYAMTGREEYVWEAQYTTHVTSLPFSRVFLNPISPGLAESPLRTPSAGPFHSVYGALPLLPFHCVYTRILERTWRRTAYTVPPALFSFGPSQNGWSRIPYPPPPPFKNLHNYYPTLYYFFLQFQKYPPTHPLLTPISLSSINTV